MLTVHPQLAIVALSADLQPSAYQLSKQLSLPCLPIEDNPDWQSISRYSQLLTVGTQGLALQQTGSGAPGAIKVDFASR